MQNAGFKSTSVICRALLTCLALLPATSGLSGAQSRFSGIVVFGTSLSDPGNAFALVGDASTPPDFLLNPLLIPTAPYAKGGHHFSNGATWIEQFAGSINLAGSVRPALASSNPGATNYAVGGARAYDDSVNFNLTRQVDAFLQRSAGVATPQALYVIEMGSNDIRDAFQVYAAGGDGAPILSAGLSAISTNVQRLYAAGAREFLIWVAPNIALTPALRSLSPAAQGLATSLTQTFNTNLAAIVTQLSAGLGGTTFTRLDADRTLRVVIADPGAFDLTNVSTACVTPNIQPFTCKTPDTFLFWDGIHPTKAGHAILAQQAAYVLQ
jgi:phospholipase/lecithinase/hemolysin